MKTHDERIVKIISEEEKSEERNEEIVSLKTTIYRREIDFNDIVRAVEIEEDSDSGFLSPWESCDSFEHEVVEVYVEGNEAGQLNDDHSTYFDQRRGLRRIVLTNFNEKEIIDHYRLKGCSRSVAKDKADKIRRSTIEQLVRWHRDGWTYYSVCFFDDEGELTASNYEIDSYDYADKEVRLEIAMEAAHHYEELGFIVINKPDRKKDYIQYQHQELKRKMLAYS